LGSRPSSCEASSGGVAAPAVFKAGVPALVAVDVAEDQQLGYGAEREPAAPAWGRWVVGGDELGAELLVLPSVSALGGAGHRATRRSRSRGAGRRTGRIPRGSSRGGGCHQERRRSRGRVRARVRVVRSRCRSGRRPGGPGRSGRPASPWSRSGTRPPAPPSFASHLRIVARTTIAYDGGSGGVAARAFAPGAGRPPKVRAER
jgi:hypothetical protein